MRALSQVDHNALGDESLQSLRYSRFGLHTDYAIDLLVRLHYQQRRTSAVTVIAK
jgi:hypothetical protein